MFDGDFVVRPLVAGSISTRKIWDVGIASSSAPLDIGPDASSRRADPGDRLPASRKEQR
jgi:hypothetical protein